MPPPNFATLAANPEALLDWLNGNLLLAGHIQNVANPPGTAWAAIVQRNPPWPGANLAAVNHAGQPMGIYDVRSDGTGPHDAVTAYICNYTANNVWSVLLGAAANFCFTVTLNGCTFGVGPDQGHSVRLVTHSNRGGQTVPQRNDIQAQHHVGPNLAGVALLEPSEYRRLGGNLQATPFIA